MGNQVHKPQKLEQIGLAKCLVDLMHRMSVHYSLWFGEVISRLGMEAAHGMDETKRCNDFCWERFSPFEAF